MKTQSFLAQLASKAVDAQPSRAAITGAHLSLPLSPFRPFTAPMPAQRWQGGTLVSFQFRGRAGLKFSASKVTLPALYDTTWRISPCLFGFRQGKQYGVLSRTGRQAMACTLPALAVGFREIIPAAVLECVAALGFGQLPPLQWVLGRLCYAGVLRAEEITWQLWRADGLRHVLSSGELVHIRPEQYAPILPAAPNAAKAAAIQQKVPMLAESGNVQLLTTWKCAESSIVLPLLQQSAGEDLNSVQAERWLAHRTLWALALLRACHVGPLADRPEEVFDWMPHDVLRLPAPTRAYPRLPAPTRRHPALPPRTSAAPPGGTRPAVRSPALATYLPCLARRLTMGRTTARNRPIG